MIPTPLGGHACHGTAHPRTTPALGTRPVVPRPPRSDAHPRAPLPQGVPPAAPRRGAVCRSLFPAGEAAVRRRGRGGHQVSRRRARRWSLGSRVRPAPSHHPSAGASWSAGCGRWARCRRCCCSCWASWRCRCSTWRW